MTRIRCSRLGNIWLASLHGVEGEGKEHPAASAGVVGVGHHPTEPLMFTCRMIKAMS